MEVSRKEDEDVVGGHLGDDCGSGSWEIYVLSRSVLMLYFGFNGRVLCFMWVYG